MALMDIPEGKQKSISRNIEINLVSGLYCNLSKITTSRPRDRIRLNKRCTMYPPKRNKFNVVMLAKEKCSIVVVQLVHTLPETVWTLGIVPYHVNSANFFGIEPEYNNFQGQWLSVGARESSKQIRMESLLGSLTSRVIVASVPLASSPALMHL